MIAPTPTSPTTAQRWPRIWGPRLWKLLAFIGLLFIYRLWVVKHSGMSLFFDEAQYWDWAQNLSWGYFSKPPMIAGLIWLSTHLFGNSVLGVKALVMLLYPITALCMVGLARALWPTSSGVRTGMVAGALFMTIPVVGLMGLFASTDAPLILCWTLAAWALWRAQLTNRMRYWVGLGVAVGLGLMSKYTMAAFALTALWTLWGVHGPRRGLLRLGPWVAAGIALLLLGPNLWWNAHNGFPTLQHTAELTTQSGRSGGVVPTLVFLLGQMLMLGPVAVVAGLWLWRRPGTPADADNTVPSSQWAPLSQVLPAGGWQDTEPRSPTSEAARSSAYYLAAVSSYRYLWAVSLPLQLIAVVQALHADAHVNWAAPSMVGFCLLIASRLSQPLVPLASPRPTRWLLAVLVTNVLLASLVLHLRDIAGPNLPSRFDALVRMRGWQEAFDQLAPVLDEPTVKGLPVLAESRLLITQAAYNWRTHGIQTVYWNPAGARDNHYALTHSLPDKVGADLLFVTDRAVPQDVLQRFAVTRLMQTAKVPLGPDRVTELHVYFLRGFLGYQTHLGQDQVGASAAPVAGEQ